ncbi:unnamed protein product [Discosporangium mesarthrocarpum]
MKVEDAVIPARFMVTLGHLIGTMMVFKTKINNVYAGLVVDPTSAQITAAEAGIDAALSVALISFIFDFIGMIFGLSIFVMKVNVIQTALHFFGGVLVAHFIMYEWDYRWIWRIVLCFNLPTAIVEIGVIFTLFYLKTAVY